MTKIDYIRTNEILDILVDYYKSKYNKIYKQYQDSLEIEALTPEIIKDCVITTKILEFIIELKLLIVKCETTEIENLHNKLLQRLTGSEEKLDEEENFGRNLTPNQDN